MILQGAGTYRVALRGLQFGAYKTQLCIFVEKTAQKPPWNPVPPAIPASVQFIDEAWTPCIPGEGK